MRLLLSSSDGKNAFLIKLRFLAVGTITIHREYSVDGICGLASDTCGTLVAYTNPQVGRLEGETEKDRPLHNHSFELKRNKKCTHT